MKSIKVIVAGCFVALLLIGCGMSSPTSVVENYFHKLQQGDLSEMNQYLLESLGSDTTSETENPEINTILAKYLETIEITVLNETISGDDASVEVERKGINFGIMVLEIFQESLAAAFSGTELSEEYMNAVMLEKVETATIETWNGTINLKKTDGEWKIVNDDAFEFVLIGSIPEF